MEPKYGKMEQNTLGTGGTTKATTVEGSFTRMEMSMKATSLMIWLKATESSNTWTPTIISQNMLENSRRTSNTELVSKLGQIIPDTKAATRMARSMVLALSTCQTARSIRVSSLITKSTVMASIPGRTTVAMKANGRTI